MNRMRALILASVLAWPSAVRAEVYPGLIIPIDQEGVEFKIEITADSTAGPFDLRIWRLDGQSMAYQRRKARELAALACASEGYSLDPSAALKVSTEGEVLLKAGCRK